MWEQRQRMEACLAPAETRGQASEMWATTPLMSDALSDPYHSNMDADAEGFNPHLGRVDYADPTEPGAPESCKGKFRKVNGNQHRPGLVVPIRRIQGKTKPPALGGKRVCQLIGELNAASVLDQGPHSH